MINAFDCIIYDYNEITADSNDAVSQIVSHTANTWQANRGTAEKGRDTKQGKQAEQAVSLFFSKYHTSVKYISYDDIRTDNFLKHAPFDGVLVDCNKVSNTTLTEKFANECYYKYGAVINFKNDETLYVYDVYLNLDEIDDLGKLMINVKGKECLLYPDSTYFSTCEEYQKLQPFNIEHNIVCSVFSDK